MTFILTFHAYTEYFFLAALSWSTLPVNTRNSSTHHQFKLGTFFENIYLEDNVGLIIVLEYILIARCNVTSLIPISAGNFLVAYKPWKRLQNLEVNNNKKAFVRWNVSQSVSKAVLFFYTTCSNFHSILYFHWNLYLFCIEFICHNNTLWNNILFFTLFCFIIFCKEKKMHVLFSKLYYNSLEMLFLHQWRKTWALKDWYILQNRGVHVF